MTWVIHGKGFRMLTTDTVVYKRSIQQKWLVTSVPTIKLPIAASRSACVTPGECMLATLKQQQKLCCQTWLVRPI